MVSHKFTYTYIFISGGRIQPHYFNEHLPSQQMNTFVREDHLKTLQVLEQTLLVDDTPNFGYILTVIMTKGIAVALIPSYFCEAAFLTSHI